MTSRLKRKLNDLGVDSSSSKATENFCLIGTPLPPLEKSKDTGEFVPLWKQEVRDEKGRRRLHGAFTGGFSAGYFNTVGSKEGWAPSTFVSSRSDRAKKKAMRPEDFMDEEDLAELRDSRQLVDENEEMSFGGTEAELRRKEGAGEDTEGDSMANAIASSLAPPPEDSAGARILRKMGWRIGQGIGPRITYQQRKAQDRTLQPGPTSKDDEDDEEAKKYMYPRRDTPLLLVPRKDNSHGLGYVPGMSLSESLGAGKDKQSSGPRISAGFGLGALNDADEDDVDVYDNSLRPSSRRIVAYDDVEDDTNIMMGSSRRRQGDSRISSKTSGNQKLRNGTTVLRGFVLSNVPVAEDRWYPLPEVPQGWKPNPRRVWEANSEKENQASTKGKERVEPPKTHAEWKSSLLTADERGSILGETPISSAQRSVFDYLSQKDRERLQNIKESLSKHPPAPPDTPGPPLPARYIPSGVVTIPPLHPSVAKAALSGFQPFTTDPVKQARYTAFLHFAAQGGTDPPIPGLELTPGQSIEDFNKELADYGKAATVFKPLSGAMAGRFRSAVVVEHGPKIIEGLHTPYVSSAQEEGEKEAEKEEKEEDPRAAAVRLGMYGPLTREVIPWQPARLLCKRFGVKDPEMDVSDADAGLPAHSAPGPDASEPAPSTAAPLAITDGSAILAPDDEKRTGPRNLANIGLGEDDEQGKDTLTYQRPSMDVFKAIFASDEEDSGDEEEMKRGEEDEGESGLSPGALSQHIAKHDVPAYLAAASSTLPKYEPASSQPQPTAQIQAEEPVDLASFKPTFVPRSDREQRKDKKDKDRDKKDRKKSGKVLVSFGDEEDGLQINVSSSSKKSKHKDKDGERKRKKRKEEKLVGDDDDDSMWVEKPAPEVVSRLDLDKVPSTPPLESQDGDSGRVAGPHRGRKRAIDFM